ncbi:MULTISPECIES: hypothetical protein [Niastella]|uniref:Lipoprotein n=1 Tax=Niastella soli TaxID=2821487 RepID=A0ABS3Z2J4_9BACT|nr:hypothetical protein [Niastella soli]MBO9204379.1 hypothetical protein [Niastella soli]
MRSMLNNSLLIAVLLLIFGLSFYSCKTKVEAESGTVHPINPGEITPGPVVNDTLSAVQLKKIKKIQRVFEEVEPSTLEETINDFKQDKAPEKEIASWYAMAKVYEKFTLKHKHLDINKKTEAYRLILMRSQENEANALAEIGLKYLTHKEVAEIFGYYNVEAKPITVEKK